MSLETSIGTRFLICIGLLLAPASMAAQQSYDIVVIGGRVIDPESGLDALRSIGIRAGRIEAIAATALQGRDTIDARNLVVAPGFIDLHAHWQTPASYDFMALDGVTTALELEGGAYPIQPWYTSRAGRARIHFGASVSHGAVRTLVMRDTAAIARARAAARSAQDSLVAARPGAYQPATAAQIRQMETLLDQELSAGGLGLGFGVATTGASLHIVHITSSSLAQTPLALELIDQARTRGLDITTELYPYEAASTSIQAPIVDPGFRARLGIDYKDILWPATGERLTAESFERYRRTGGPIVAFVIPPEALRAAPASRKCADAGLCPIEPIRNRNRARDR